MHPLRSELIRNVAATLCIGVLTVHAFTLSVDAGPSKSKEEAASQTMQMPTARDLAIFERQLRKATRDSRFAETCGRGQLMGSAEIHVAMSFAPVGRPATDDRPGVARAHVIKTDGAPKALVIESKNPTIWTVTGSPDVIVLLGRAVIADRPDGTAVFAPRFADACGEAKWAYPPANWTFPEDQAALSSLVDDVQGRFGRRAETVATYLFDRSASAWRVGRGDAVMTF